MGASARLLKRSDIKDDVGPHRRRSQFWDTMSGLHGLPLGDICSV